MKQDENYILVIGGAGYIGSHIVADLCDSGNNVIVFDNLSTGYKSNIHCNAEFIEGDILDKVAVDNALSQGIKTIFHFAALKAAGDSMIVPSKFSDINISGSVNLLNAIAKFGIKNIIFSSSAAVYGYPQYLPVDEGHRTLPINYYGFTKLIIEQMIKWYAKIYGFNYSLLRYFNAAGYDIHGRIINKEKGSTNLLPIIMEVLIGERDCLSVFGNDYKTKDGTCIRDYIHVNDLSDAHIMSLDYMAEKRKDLLVNLATGEGYSVKDVVKIAEKVSGKTINCKFVDRRAGDPEELIAKTTNAYDLLNWIPKHSDLSTIIRSMWEVYRR